MKSHSSVKKDNSVLLRKKTENFPSQKNDVFKTFQKIFKIY